ncbi:hypothetical protein Agub_g13676 [Astrephomene gubernaculifera]|uniref:UGP3-like C-terminal hexapeptide repeats domain-containing protein n=1 Tax=Astrephomene gubernaculifera TaxID=47775 RepID=A0AAD3E075_9CHLO|nr:hypothetical protein Agub_g13676 [Astrephomene gubernaculifera]
MASYVATSSSIPSAAATAAVAPATSLPHHRASTVSGRRAVAAPLRTKPPTPLSSTPGSAACLAPSPSLSTACPAMIRATCCDSRSSRSRLLLLPPQLPPQLPRQGLQLGAHRSGRTAVRTAAAPPPPPPASSSSSSFPYPLNSSSSSGLGSHYHPRSSSSSCGSNGSPPPPQATAAASAATAPASPLAAAASPQQTPNQQQHQAPSPRGPSSPTAASPGSNNSSSNSGTVASYEDEYVLPADLAAEIAAAATAATGSAAGAADADATTTAAAAAAAVPVPAAVPSPAVFLSGEVERLQGLLGRLRGAGQGAEEKLRVLQAEDSVAAFLADPSHASMCAALRQLPPSQQQLLLCLPAMGQQHVLMEPLGAPSSPPASLAPQLSSLASRLARVEQFYDSVGGLLGYQLKSLQLILAGMQDKAARMQEQQQQHPQQQQQQPTADASPTSPASASSPSATFHVPRGGLDLAGEAGAGVGVAAAAQGLAGLPFTAEIYPVGGAGDRLGLVDEASGASLPAAMLPYAGRSLLEVLLRDLQAREYLYFQLTGRQVTTPVAIMTSDAKGNHERVSELLGGRLRWAGRGRGGFRLFRQPMVPVMGVEDGRWLLSRPLAPMMKPGGHGAIWKLMWDEGVFNWLVRQHGRRAAIVRQISNPMAGTDTTLLALAGAGFARRGGGAGAFGFMSCERAVGAAEGMNVLQERRRWVPHGAEGAAAATATATARNNNSNNNSSGGSAGGSSSNSSSSSNESGGRWVYEYGITNVEYTEFERLGLSDEAVPGSSGTTSVFPANTNVLFVGLMGARKIVEQAISRGDGAQLLPGLIFNLNKKVSYTDPLLSYTGANGDGSSSNGSSDIGSSMTSTDSGGSSSITSGTGSSISSGSSSSSAATATAAAVRQVAAGRMESTMQNLADFLTDRFERPMDPQQLAASQQLSTFLVSNLRRKVTSSAKKRRAPGSSRIAQTPDGSFYDLTRNAWQLLQRCGLADVPEPGSPEQYLERGPGFIFLFHPALGPLWDVIAQKLSGGCLAAGSELVLEVAEARVRGLRLEGSLQVYAENVMGHTELEGQPSATDAAAALQLAYDNSPSSYNSNNNPSLPYTSLSSSSPTSPSFSFTPSCTNGNGNGTNGNGANGNGVHSHPNEASAAAAAASNGSAAGSGYSNGNSNGNGNNGHIAEEGRAGGGGSSGDAILRYGRRCGRVSLVNVRVCNAGINWQAPDNVYWKHQVSRHETCKIVLLGQSEFEAQDVTIPGDQAFIVPDGYRLSVTAAASADADGPSFRTTLTPLTPLAAVAAGGGGSGGGYQPSWEWRYTMDTSGAVRLSYISHTGRDQGTEGTGPRTGMVATVMAAAEQRSECVLDFSI